jgi:hypothetical protein
VRIVLCDGGGLLRESVEALIPKVGHEIVGIADTTALGVNLVAASRPDAVVFDMALGYNTDFDVIEAAQDLGAKVVVFSYNADDTILAGYPVRPVVVHKPDLVALEVVLRRLEVDADHGVVEHERRARPSRDLSVPAPTGVVDAAAFYEAINEAQPGDALVSIDVPADAAPVAERMLDVMRRTDRLLATSHTLRVFLVAGGEIGVTSFLVRLGSAGVLPSDVTIHSVIVGEGESPLEAFDRLKSQGTRHSLPG